MKVATPLDGDLELSLRMPLGAGHTLEVLNTRGAVVSRGLWSGSSVRTLRYQVCGGPNHSRPRRPRRRRVAVRASSNRALEKE